MLSTEIAEAARYCLANGINFAVCAMPGSPDVTFIADDGTPWSGDESDMKGFFINRFMNRYPVPVLIRPQWDCRSVIGQNGEIPVKSTWKENDFLILNPKLGALVLEVKGGDIVYKNCVFQQINTNTKEVNILNPEKKNDPLSLN